MGRQEGSPLFTHSGPKTDMSKKVAETKKTENMWRRDKGKGKGELREHKIRHFMMTSFIDEYLEDNFHYF